MSPMPTAVYFILDFDSTLVRVETLEVMAGFLPDSTAVKERIRVLTDAAMDGKLDFRTALAERLKILHVHRDLLPKLIAHLKNEISPSFEIGRASCRERV